jgi:RluA family pseudouridine synthase
MRFLFMLQIFQMPLKILFEDAHILAVSKPSGQVVIPGRGILSGEPLIKEVEKHTRTKMYVVHRLDRDAGGLMLFAKDPASHRALSLQFERRETHKKYWVAVEGRLAKDGCINQPLREFGSGRIGVHPDGKPSVTDYRIRDALSSQATLLEVSPQTGRRHQIRVHLYSIGHPVLGDRLYGKNRPVGGTPRLMLHAWKLGFTHPDGRTLNLQDDPPNDFMDLLRQIRI